MAVDLNNIVDLDRYPIHRVGSSGYRALLEKCQTEVNERALCMLPGFVRPEVVLQLADELESLVNIASRFDIERTAYIKPVDPELPDGHPRKIPHTTKYHQVLNYQIANNSMLRQLFYWQPLTEFFGQAMGFKSFYRSDCPHLALTSKIAGEGDTDGWHYDSNEAVFSLVLQQPEKGGEFEYLPNIRSNGHENYETISAAFENPEPYSSRFNISPGTLVLFKGMASVHRVTPVQGPRRRIVALFSYHHQPGHVNTQSYIEIVHSQMPSPGIPQSPIN